MKLNDSTAMSLNYLEWREEFSDKLEALITALGPEIMENQPAYDALVSLVWSRATMQVLAVRAGWVEPADLNDLADELRGGDL